DLGSPLGGQNILNARGAQVGDLLCAFDAQREYFGCTEVNGTSERLQLHQNTTWQPEIRVRPITSSTLEVHVQTLSATALPASLNAQVFPEFGEAGAAVELNAANNYTAQFSFTTRLDNGTEVPIPVTLGHVHLWAGEMANPDQAAMVAFRMGGNVGRWPALRGSGPALRGSGPALRGSGPALRGSGAGERGGNAPVVSADGQMIFFTDDPTEFQPGELYTLQNTSILPPLPPEKKLVGLGYHLLASPNRTDTIAGSISLQYLGTDALQQGVTEEDEAQLTIYFYGQDDGITAPQWRPLSTVRNTRYNLASAPSQGVGLYALLAGPQQPEVTGIEPNWAYNNQAVAITINGVELLAPLSVRLLGADGYASPAYAATLQDPGTLVFTLPAGLPAQEYQVEVQNGDQSIVVAPRTFALLAQQAGVCFFDHFESGPGQWQLSGAWGVVALPNGAGPAITDSPTGNYNSALPGAGTLSTAITSRPFNLSDCSDPQLTFNHAYVIATGDGNNGHHDDWGIVEIRINEGDWETLATYQGGGIFSIQSAADGAEWQGTTLQSADPINLAGYTGMVQLRFRLEVDEHVADRGWVINDIMVQPAGGAAGAPNQLANRLFLPVVMR
ncbi:MAG: hypothetical protein KDE19_09580, partial [Caldilineaceae bacterium]|nr:hypothetical protein [Caldilineaceae bacterium]